jgi:hypothetical protein
VDAESEGRFDAILTSLLTRTWKHTLSSLEGRSCDVWHLQSSTVAAFVVGAALYLSIQRVPLYHRCVTVLGFPTGSVFTALGAGGGSHGRGTGVAAGAASGATDMGTSDGVQVCDRLHL